MCRVDSKTSLYLFLIFFAWKLLGAEQDDSLMEERKEALEGNGFTNELEETHPDLAATWLFQARGALFHDDNVGHVEFSIIQTFIDDWDLTASDAKWVNHFFASMKKKYRGLYKGFKHSYDTQTVNERMESLNNRNVNKPKMRKRFKYLFEIEPSAAKFLATQELWDAVTIDANWKLFRRYIQQLKASLEERSLSENAFACRFTYVMNLITQGYIVDATEINILCNPDANEVMLELPLEIVKSLLKSGLKIEKFILPPKLFKAIESDQDVNLLVTMLNRLRPKIAAIETMRSYEGKGNDIKVQAIFLKQRLVLN